MTPLPSHWSRRYVVDKARLVAYQWTHPSVPWLCPGAVTYLTNWLRTEHTGAEWGAGRSTLWLARRTSRLVSVEHDPEWAARIRRQLGRNRIFNVELRECSSDRGPRAYTESILLEPDASLDFILVDGLYRDACAQAALQKIRPGGLLIIDNIERYLPSKSRSPEAIGPHSHPISEVWRDVANALAEWQCNWITCGVTDTAIFAKPGGHTITA